MSGPRNTRRHIFERWMAAADWLGSQKPLELILGAVGIIAAVSLLAHLT
jgi:hypothetical protein